MGKTKKKQDATQEQKQDESGELSIPAMSRETRVQSESDAAKDQPYEDFVPLQEGEWTTNAVARLSAAILARRSRLDGIGRKSLQLYFLQGRDLFKMAALQKELSNWGSWRQQNGFNHDTVNRYCQFYEMAVAKYGNERAAYDNLPNDYEHFAAACRDLGVRIGDKGDGDSADPVKSFGTTVTRLETAIGKMTAEQKAAVKKRVADLLKLFD